MSQVFLEQIGKELDKRESYRELAQDYLCILSKVESCVLLFAMIVIHSLTKNLYLTFAVLLWGCIIGGFAWGYGAQLESERNPITLYKDIYDPWESWRFI